MAVYQSVPEVLHPGLPHIQHRPLLPASGPVHHAVPALGQPDSADWDYLPDNDGDQLNHTARVADCVLGPLGSGRCIL